MRIAFLEDDLPQAEMMKNWLYDADHSCRHFTEAESFLRGIRQESYDLLILITLLFVREEWLWRWDQVLYDTQLRMWSRPPPEDIVIVAIDAASLAALGRWPWSRAIHADVVTRLTKAGVRAIVLDILFSEEERHDPCQSTQRE